MNKFLLFILLTSFSFFAKAQETRAVDNNPLPEIQAGAEKGKSDENIGEGHGDISAQFPR